jgi:hypothetical protein
MANNAIQYTTPTLRSMARCSMFLLSFPLKRASAEIALTAWHTENANTISNSTIARLQPLIRPPAINTLPQALGKGDGCSTLAAAHKIFQLDHSRLSGCYSLAK